jgi:hypothetical protein
MREVKWVVVKVKNKAHCLKLQEAGFTIGCGHNVFGFKTVEEVTEFDKQYLELKRKEIRLDTLLKETEIIKKLLEKTLKDALEAQATSNESPYEPPYESPYGF